MPTTHVHIERDEAKAQTLIDAALTNTSVRMRTEFFQGQAIICGFKKEDDYWEFEFYADGENYSPNADPFDDYPLGPLNTTPR